jgi:hypothetical protein
MDKKVSKNILPIHYYFVSLHYGIGRRKLSPKMPFSKRLILKGNYRKKSLLPTMHNFPSNKSLTKRRFVGMPSKDSRMPSKDILLNLRFNLMK